MATVLGTAAIVMFSGCTSARLAEGRRAFYQKDFARAADKLEPPAGVRNRVLFLMEAGMVEQVDGDYVASCASWNEAAALIEKLGYISLSRRGASWFVNDTTKAFRGAPYEQNLLHAFCAKSYMALQQWNDAAVEARILADALTDLKGFPDDAYCHYLVGTVLSFAGSYDNAAISFERADELTPHVRIDHRSGRLADAPPEAHELICFIGIGPFLFPPLTTSPTPYVTLEVDGKAIGRSYGLSRTDSLWALTEAKRAAGKVAKTVGRIVVKEGVAHAVSEKNVLAGELLRLLFYMLEIEDTRRWSTLPIHLQVARVPYPLTARGFTAKLVNAEGHLMRELHVSSPLARRDGKAVSFLRFF